MKIRNLEEAEMLPQHLSARKDSGYDSWEHFCNARNYYAIIYRVCESMIGESYEACNAKVIKKFESLRVKNSKYEAGLMMKSMFKGYYPRFIIDENGNVAYSFDRVRHKKKDIDLSEEEVVSYKLKPITDEASYKAHTKLRNIIGNDLYTYTTCGTISPKAFDKYERLFDWHGGDKKMWNDAWLYNCKFSENILKYRSPEYQRYRAEKKKAEGKQTRECKAAMEARVEEMMRLAQLRKKELDEENKNKIIRHGFDLKYSFRK